MVKVRVHDPDGDGVFVCEVNDHVIRGVRSVTFTADAAGRPLAQIVVDVASSSEMIGGLTVEVVASHLVQREGPCNSA